MDREKRQESLSLVPVDDVLASTAAKLAGRLRVRGADAVYVADGLGLRLVMWDFEQRDRAEGLVDVLVPEDGDGV